MTSSLDIYDVIDVELSYFLAHKMQPWNTTGKRVNHKSYGIGLNWKLQFSGPMRIRHLNTSISWHIRFVIIEILITTFLFKSFLYTRCWMRQNYFVFVYLLYILFGHNNYFCFEKTKIKNCRDNKDIEKNKLKKHRN